MTLAPAKVQKCEKKSPQAGKGAECKIREGKMGNKEETGGQQDKA